MSQPNAWITIGRLTAILLLALIVAACGPELPTPAVSLQSPIETPTETPTARPHPTRTPPRATPTPPRATVTPAPSDLDDFVFGEPRIAFTHTAPIAIAGWLPSSEELLLTVQQPNTITETIETFNVQTHERRLLAARPANQRPPVWLHPTGRVAYTAFAEVGGIEFDLWIQDPEANQASQPVLKNVNWAIASLGDQVLALPKGQGRPVEVDAAGRVLRDAAFDLHSLGFNPDYFTYFRIEAHPSLPLLAIYDDTYFAIIDSRQGTTQMIDFGEELTESGGYGPRWAYYATWSPDGRKLAVLITVGEPFFPYVALGIINVAADEYFEIDLGEKLVNDVAWSSDNRHLAALAKVRVDEFGVARNGLFLVDSYSHDSRRILPDLEFGGRVGSGIVWSPTNQTLVTLCASETRRQEDGRLVGEIGLCIVPVRQYPEEGDAS